MRLPRHIAVLSLLLLTASAAPRSAGAMPDVRLSEILAGPSKDWDGSGTFSSRDDEWIEIVNGGATPADLTPYFVTDGDSIPRFGFTGTLAPGAVLLVTGAASVAWERATSHPVFGLSLGNTGDSVLLWKVTGSDTTLVDRRQRVEARGCARSLHRDHAAARHRLLAHARRAEQLRRHPDAARDVGEAQVAVSLTGSISGTKRARTEPP
jgi:hypothetical protein